LEICYGSICFVTNAAEGTIAYEKTASSEGLVPKEYLDREEKLRNIIGSVIEEALSLIPLRRDCICKEAQVDAKNEGILSEDWSEWFQ
jgi:5'-methylthioadenosine phosphorylase